MPFPSPGSCSPNLLDLLQQCLNKNPLQRPSADALLQHPWLQLASRSGRVVLRRRHMELLASRKCLRGPFLAGQVAGAGGSLDLEI